MGTRQKFSAALIGIGIILAVLPYNGHSSLTGRTNEVALEVFNENAFLSVDKVAQMIVNEDSSLRLIDLRPAEQFNAFSLPGAVNLPYEKFISADPSEILGPGNIKNVIYSNGDTQSSYALVIAKGMKHQNVFVMKGGMNEWFSTIMNSRFTGGRISPAENAIFETRTRASRLFSEINSLPDSLKEKLRESKKLAAKKLDGGCE